MVFTGVDVFFVISGFLITEKISRDVEGRAFSFAAFYMARVRRILPALMATVLLTFLISALVMSPFALQDTAKEILAAVFSWSNIYFWLDSDYFAAEAYSRPLLHTWSLSVEEQFYLVWPSIVIGLMALKKSLREATLVALIIFGTALGEFWLNDDPSAAFFLTPFRVAEFAIGALLTTFNRRTLSRPVIGSMLTIVGLGIIIACTVLYDEETLFPGVHALWPCLGAALCLYGGLNPLAKKLLANRVSVGIGKISYSLYLVHWPIIVFAEYLLL